MEKREFYSVKDIILGSREQYMDTDMYLSILRSLCHVYDHRVKDFYFRLSKTRKDEKPKLVCHFIREMETLRGKIVSIQKRFKGYDSSRYIACCVKGQDDKYVVANKQFNVHIDDDMVFAEEADQLLKSDFINKMQFGVVYCQRNSEEFMNDLMLFPNKIELTMIDSNDSLKCRYYPWSDTINVSINDVSYAPEFAVRKALDFRIPASCLGEYHKEIIESSPIVHRSVEIVSEVPDNYRGVELVIDDRSKNKVVLRRVKSRDSKRRY